MERFIGVVRESSRGLPLPASRCRLGRRVSPFLALGISGRRHHLSAREEEAGRACLAHLSGGIARRQEDLGSPVPGGRNSGHRGETRGGERIEKNGRGGGRRGGGGVGVGGAQLTLTTPALSDGSEACGKAD